MSSRTKTYIVMTREVWVRPVEVKAKSKKEALRIVWREPAANYVELDDEFEYSHILEPDHWTVEEKKHGH